MLVSLAGLKQVRLLDYFTQCCDAHLGSLYYFCACLSFLLVSQIKDILKGALRFNQSQLEAEENEEITIADDHYTSTACACETVLGGVNHHLREGDTCRRDSSLDVAARPRDREEEEEVEEEEERAATPPPPQVN